MKRNIKISREEIAATFRRNRGSMKELQLSLRPPVSSCMISNWMAGNTNSERVEAAAIAMYPKLKRRTVA